MESSLSEEEGIYHNVIETLYQTFGQVLTRDVICAIVESCYGDVDQSANAIMNMTHENEQQPSPLNVENNREDQHTRTESFDHIHVGESNSVQNVREPQNDNQLGFNQNIQQHTEPYESSSAGNMPQANSSYSGMAQSAKRPGRYRNKQTNSFPVPDSNFWTSQIKQILMHHNKGSRILIIMRGVPGSGKTYLANRILEATIGGSKLDFATHIFSADNYFMVKGFYRYDKMKLQDAHIWNNARARIAMKRGVSPVIIDNTNVEPWEMEPYLRDGVNNGYLIEIVEPNTSWAKKANQLSRKNVHNVPLLTIKRMLGNFQDDITAERMMNYYKLSYPDHMMPPVLRNFPVIPIQSVPIENNSNADGNAVPTVQRSEDDCDTTHENMTVQNKEVYLSGLSNPHKQIMTDAKNEQYQMGNTVDHNVESNMQIEELEQIHEAWDANEKWEDDQAEIKIKCKENYESCDNGISGNSKPPRKKLNKSMRSLEDIKSDIDNFSHDWTKIDMFNKPWDSTCKLDEKTPPIVVEKVSRGTSIDPDDTNFYNENNARKLLSTEPRDINRNHMPLGKEKIPVQRMFDKSCYINEQSLEYMDYDYERAFVELRNRFLCIPQSEVRNVFEICYGNIDWATSILVEGVANNEFSRVKSEEESPESDEQGFCTDDKTLRQADSDANKTSFIDSKGSTSATADQISNETINNISPYDILQPTTNMKRDQLLENILTPRKSKKANTSEHHMHLKRQIEKSIVISDNHYSQQCLKLRNQRQGIQSKVTANENSNEENVNIDNTEVSRSIQGPDEQLPSTSNGLVGIQKNCNNTGYGSENNSDDNENNSPKPEKYVNINLSWDLIAKLDEEFGRDEMVYPQFITPIINIPQSLLNEINALWMESYINQSQAKHQETELMMQQDEEIARELESQEFELYAAEESKMSDVEEVTDNELAVSLQRNNNSKWLQGETMTMAAKLTLEKLKFCFANVNPKVLADALSSHNNNFNNTVEALLIFTGQEDIVQRENGVKDFIMAKGIEHREKQRNERKQELANSEPLFSTNKEKVDMKLVQSYRDKAEVHLKRRNQMHQKARDSMSNGRLRIAMYYSEVAAMHTQNYDHFNSLAVSALIQVGTAKTDYTATLDLHFLRVKEAMVGLDLFIDANLNRLREIQATSNISYMTLYFITGRGLHSSGLPRIKPAVQRRLRQRGLDFSERNPGLLMAKVYANHGMTHEIA
ncbi:PREDICTED: uncharacterized protein LOC106099277 isoform X2 [Papilio polytes]|uniref:uncharacterized protein LOC106099277 isoform X2 n=1 Tax=Papilio polytes TaxID=76194 RepID=UPI000675C775|nr:PREDICTED: uncharacterized protein LOC106099277 isoform X2 [Papilio polytes]